MGKCPRIDWSWLLSFPLCSASKSCVCDGEFILVILFQTEYVSFAFINYFVVLVSVSNFTSFPVFCALHYRYLLRKWQLPVTLQELHAQRRRIATTCWVTQRRCEHPDRVPSVRLTIGQLISCSKPVTLLGNCGCVAVSSFLGVCWP